MGSPMRSPRRRLPIKRVTFTDHAGDNNAALRNTFDRGISLPEEEREYRGAQKPLDWGDAHAAKATHPGKPDA